MSDQIIQVSTNKTVSNALDALETVLTEKGAIIVARVNHGAGGASIGVDIGKSELLIFGNPKLGTPVMVDDRLAGLFLPLKILGYTDAEGKTWLSYQDPAVSFGGLDLPEGAAYVRQMQDALENFVAAVA